MAAEGDLQLPLGFRFHPTDEELVMHYLLRKCASLSIAAPVIAEVDLYKYNAWDLPGLASYGEKEWYFFSPRDRKYPNGSRPNRVAGTGYWKATGADKPIGSPKPAGIKKALVFYSGKSPGGEKTNWIMHEYRLANVDRSGSKKKKKSIRLDDWVLCRIYHKKGIITETGKKMIDAVIEDENIQTIIPRLVPETSSVVSNDFMYLDASDSVPRIPTDSSCSEHELSPEVESAAPKMAEWEGSALDFPCDYINGEAGAGSPLISSQFDESFQIESMQELF